MMVIRLFNLFFLFALRAFPKRHRDRYAAEMTDAFDRELASRRSRGSRDAIVFAMAALSNLVTSGIAERRRHHVVRVGYFFSVLDFTLAWRMLVRYPGLTVISVFGMAIAITIAGGAFAVITAIVETRLPLPEGERIVSVISTSKSLSGHEWRMLYDYASWRKATSLVDLSLSHEMRRNLIIEGRTPEPVTVAAISPSAFRVTRTEAFRGRYLLDDDARLGADNVLVIGHDEWLRRFDGDAEIIGRTVQLGGTTHTIVGVMPNGFAFPINHSFWIPWRTDPAVYQPLAGPDVVVFGRLAPGATFESAQAELDAFGQRAAAESPATHEHRQPLVIPYAHAYNDQADPENQLSMRAIELSMAMVLILVCVNVAILVYARTVARQGEIAVRGALGASRHRIVAQLFVEALTLSGVAAVIGLSFITIALPLIESQTRSITGGRLPFWMHFQIAADDLTYLVGLTFLSAAIVGILPALKATGKNVQARLQTLSSGGGSRMQMGPVWTLLIVAQVALTVAVLPAAMFFTWESLRLRPTSMGFASSEFLSATLSLAPLSEPQSDREKTALAIQFAAQHAELEEALRAEPVVVDLTFSSPTDRAMALEVEGLAVPEDPVNYGIAEGSDAGHLVRFRRVATGYFDAYDIPLLVGRSFTPADRGTNQVVVNRTVVDRIFEGANPLGRRIRYIGRSEEAGEGHVQLNRWFEIVGVVPDFPDDEWVADSVIYHPAEYGDLNPVQIALRMRGSDPASHANMLRVVAAKVNPDLQLRDVATTELLVKQAQAAFRMIGVTVGLVMLSVIILSAAGIYALMSFTVERRRREIGIRAALGADRSRLLTGIFARALGQLALGAGVGLAGAFAVQTGLEGELFEQGRGLVLLPVVVVVMSIVGIIAAAGPARKGLSVQPIEALRED
jgi:putative ABC transport system permease protein